MQGFFYTYYFSDNLILRLEFLILNLNNIRYLSLILQSEKPFSYYLIVNV